MTKSEYGDYEERVKGFLTENGLAGLIRPTGRYVAYYSSIPCSVCGSEQAGSRLDMKGMVEKEGSLVPDVIEYSYPTCTKCEHYLMYGELDNQTMIEMEGD